MLGKPVGLHQLDLSADGFWNSFFAILVAVPALVVGWAGVSNDVAVETATFAGRFGIVVRLAVVDIGAWVLPLIALALVAPRVGIGDRFVHYVVASNWTSEIIAWLMLPAALARMLFPAAENVVSLLVLFSLQTLLGIQLPA